MSEREDGERRETTRAANEKPRGIAREMLALLRTDAKFWLVPIVVILLAFGLLMLLGSASTAPFIYTHF